MTHAHRQVSYSSVYIYYVREELQWQLCLWVKCSRHPDNITTRHAHTLRPLYNSPFRQRCAHQTKKKKAHTIRCSTSSEVMKQTKTLKRQTRKQCAQASHTHQPHFVRAAHSLAHGALTLEEVDKRTRGRRATWQQLRVLR